MEEDARTERSGGEQREHSIDEANAEGGQHAERLHREREDARPKVTASSVLSLADVPLWAHEEAWPQLEETNSSTSSSDETESGEHARKLDVEDDRRFGRVFAPAEHINAKVSLWRGDITRLEVDAIVNAARPSLLGGGGIDKAIHRAAGPDLLHECRTLGGCVHGQCKVTQGYDLPCRLVFHAVGPNRDLHDDEKGYPLLASAYKSCLQRVLEHEVRSIAFCCISTGAYRFPSRPAAHVALSIVRRWLEQDDNRSKVDRIIFVTFLEQDETIYRELMHRFYFPLP